MPLAGQAAGLQGRPLMAGWHDRTCLYALPCPACNASCFILFCAYLWLPVQVMDGGMVSLEVLSKAGPDITARVVDPGGASGPVGTGQRRAGTRQLSCRVPTDLEVSMHRSCKVLPLGPKQGRLCRRFCG